MKDIDNNVEIRGIEKFKYCDIWDFNIQMIREFIYNLDDETIYTIIPFVTVSHKLKDPTLILSKQILVTRYSSSETIYNYIFKQFELAEKQFNMGYLNSYNVYFKYRRLTFSKKFPFLNRRPTLKPSMRCSTELTLNESEIILNKCWQFCFSF
jgi:hypothetical protein